MKHQSRLDENSVAFQVLNFTNLRAIGIMLICNGPILQGACHARKDVPQFSAQYKGAPSIKQCNFTTKVLLLKHQTYICLCTLLFFCQVEKILIMLTLHVFAAGKRVLVQWNLYMISTSYQELYQLFWIIHDHGMR